MQPHIVVPVHPPGREGPGPHPLPVPLGQEEGEGGEGRAAPPLGCGPSAPETQDRLCCAAVMSRLWSQPLGTTLGSPLMGPARLPVAGSRGKAWWRLGGHMCISHAHVTGQSKSMATFGVLGTRDGGLQRCWVHSPRRLSHPPLGVPPSRPRADLRFGPISPLGPQEPMVWRWLLPGETGGPWECGDQGGREVRGSAGRGVIAR